MGVLWGLGRLRRFSWYLSSGGGGQDDGEEDSDALHWRSLGPPRGSRAFKIKFAESFTRRGCPSAPGTEAAWMGARPG